MPRVHAAPLPVACGKNKDGTARANADRPLRARESETDDASSPPRRAPRGRLWRALRRPGRRGAGDGHIADFRPHRRRRAVRQRLLAGRRWRCRCCGPGYESPKRASRPTGASAAPTSSPASPSPATCSSGTCRSSPPASPTRPSSPPARRSGWWLFGWLLFGERAALSTLAGLVLCVAGGAALLAAELPSPPRRRDRRSLRHRHRRLFRPLFPRGEGGAAHAFGGAGHLRRAPSSPLRCC